ncbi:MAG TPA: hypothetical protein VNU45_18095 [Rummeliibacillus sp.]|nr:hypothetical protein [Rummeliibacillus sp.]
MSNNKPTKNPHSTAMQEAFNKALDACRPKIEPAPFVGKLSVEQIKNAVNSVSKPGKTNES